MSSDWSSSTFRAALVALVRRRVPDKDAEDVVQATLVEAMASATRPSDPEALRRWIWGIARNKVADYHRRARREVFDVPDVPATPVLDGDADDLLRWASREIPEGQDTHQTFEWLLREGEGEKLESIAEAEKVPPARVRKRVSRMRQHFRTRRAAEVAALAALGVASILLAIWIAQSSTRLPDAPIAQDPSTSPAPESPHERAVKERDEALDLCGAQKWQACLDKLDRAGALAPEINAEPDVQRARTRADGALKQERDSRIELPTPQDLSAPTATGKPAPPPRRNTGKPGPSKFDTGTKGGGSGP